MTEQPIVLLAALMGLVTYGTRVAPFVLPLPRLGETATGAMRFTGPAAVAAVAAVALAFPAAAASAPDSMLPVWLGTGVCIVIVAWRRNLAAGIVGALVVALLAGSQPGP